MKRRSARPVVVEVKRARSPTSSPAEVFGRSRPGSNLWQGVPLRAEAPTLPRREPEPPVATIQRVEPDARPAPRILPSLVPMFVPSEPEPQEGATQTIRATRGARAERKPRASRIKSTVVSARLDSTVAAETRTTIPAAAEQHPSIVLAPTRPVPLAQPQAGRRKRGQCYPELRRGERWKRRLPRACW
jgi:hypothetical protein